MRCKPEVLATIEEMIKYYDKEVHMPSLENDKITRISSDIVKLLEKEDITFGEADTILNFTKRVLNYKATKVNL